MEIGDGFKRKYLFWQFCYLRRRHRHAASAQDATPRRSALTLDAAQTKVQFSVEKNDAHGARDVWRRVDPCKFDPQTGRAGAQSSVNAVSGEETGTVPATSE